MKQSNSQSTEERRSARRLPELGTIELRLCAQSIHGKAQNFSNDGLYIVAEVDLRVEVHVDGEAKPRSGKLVRLEARREGETGLAVKFD